MTKVSCSNCGADNPSNFKYCSSCGHTLPIIAKVEEIVDLSEKPKPSKTNLKKWLGIIVGVIVFWSSYYLVQKFLFRPSFDKVLMEAASEINKTCPVMLDQYTRFDNAIALPDNVFQYNYTLMDVTKEQINTDTLSKYIDTKIINNAKTNPDLKLYRENETTLVYYYKDMNGSFVYKLTVTPEMYK